MENKPNVILNKEDKAVVDSIKDIVYKTVSFKCLEKLTEFNDCRETGIKKNKKIKAMKDEETKYYEVTKGCFDEYQEYIGCVRGIVNEIAQQKEVTQLLMGRWRKTFTRQTFKDYLIADYKLI